MIIWDSCDCSTTAMSGATDLIKRNFSNILFSAVKVAGNAVVPNTRCPMKDLSSARRAMNMVWVVRRFHKYNYFQMVQWRIVVPTSYMRVVLTLFIYCHGYNDKTGWCTRTTFKQKLVCEHNWFVLYAASACNLEVRLPETSQHFNSCSHPCVSPTTLMGVATLCDTNFLCEQFWKTDSIS